MASQLPPVTKVLKLLIKARTLWRVPALSFLLLGSCSESRLENSEPSDTPLMAGKIQIDLEEVLVIGGQGSPESTWLGDPRHVVTDDVHSLIYISDSAKMNVRVFDRQGTFLRNIGSRGRNRGEFLNIAGIFVNTNHQLTVADNFNKRVTVFDRAGKVLSSTGIEEDFLWHGETHDLGAHYVVLARLPEHGRNGKALKASNYLFHLFDQSLQRIGMFGDVSDVIEEGKDKNRIHRLFTQTYPGHFWPLDSQGQSIIYSPASYHGQLYRYGVVNGKWQFINVLRGFTADHVGISVSSHEADQPMPKKVGVIVTEHGRRSELIVHSLSLGVFADRLGRIVHFAMMEFGNERKLVVQIFGSDGVLQGYDALEFATTDAGMLDWWIPWKDNEDLYYFINRGRHPVVMVARLAMAPQIALESDGE